MTPKLRESFPNATTPAPPPSPALPTSEACDYIADMLEGLRDLALTAGLRDLAGVLELAGVAADRARQGG